MNKYQLVKEGTDIGLAPTEGGQLLSVEDVVAQHGGWVEQPGGEQVAACTVTVARYGGAGGPRQPSSRKTKRKAHRAARRRNRR